MKYFLKECYSTVKKMTGVDPIKPGNAGIRQILVDDTSFSTYIDALSEPIKGKPFYKDMRMLAENTRRAMLENSMFYLNPYETLTMPLFFNFYPKMVAKEGITVIPVDSPDVIKGFLRPKFIRSDGSEYDAPAYVDVTKGLGVGLGSAEWVAFASGKIEEDILAKVKDASGSSMNLDPSIAHIQKDFRIVSVESSASPVEVLTTNIVPTVDGTFAHEVKFANGDVDMIFGHIDYFNGTVCLTSKEGKIARIAYRCTVSMEENLINPKVKFGIDKLRLTAVDRQLQAEWSIQLEQDARALFDIDLQAQLISIMGRQVAMDRDMEIINNIIDGVQTLAPANHVDSFNKTVPTGYAWGPKYWYENILVKLNELSAQVMQDTQLGVANVIFANPLDAAVLEALEEYHYDGNSFEGGDLGFQAAKISGKWKVLVSSVVPQGKMILIYKPVEEIKAVFFDCPYVPAVITPYPLGPKPAMTILTRYSQLFLRPLGACVLNITNS